MVMKRPPAVRVPEQGCRSPRLDFRGDGASLYVSWKISPSPNFLGLRATYRRRGGAGRCRGPPGDPQARPRVGPRLAPPWGPQGTPPDLLRSLSSFRVKTDLRGFFSPFREYFLKNFSEIQKQQKRATGLGHLVNMLVYENIRKTKENMRTCGKHKGIG